MTNVFNNGLTDEQEFIVVKALRRRMQPLLNEKVPSCCPFSITGLQRMSSHNPKLYSQVAAYHNWPTDFVHLNNVATRIPCPMGSVRSHQALHDHATTLARKAPAFYTPAQKPPHPCEEDEESDDDDEEARNLQAHVVLKHLYM